jgi:murein DD-endopeptidase MepM/ murein hydrolase activator NlpD
LKFRPLLAALLFSVANIPMPAQSQGVFNASGLNASAPSDFDLDNFSYSFANMGSIQSSGSMNYPGLGQMSWASGTRPEDLFTVGMFSDYGFKNLSLNQIGAVTGQPVAQGSLASFPLMQSLTVSQLAQAIPGLAQTPLSQVPPIAALAQQQGVFSGGTVGSIASAVQGPIGQLGGQLVSYGISQIPGLSSTSLSQLPGIDVAKISDIPGLDQFPLINPLSIKDWFVPFDIGYGMSPCNMGGDCHERNIDNTASGNLKDMSIPCMGKDQSCAHIEVRRNFANPTKNIRWISKEQKVPGGSGLGAEICDEEPTGRFPLGPNPKVVLEDIDEAAGEIEFALYFSVHVDLDESDSAHCFGPFPMLFFGSAKEGQWILFGPDKVPKNSPFASMGGSGPSGSGGGSGSGGDYGGTCIASDGKTSSIYKGVNVASFKNAISNVESRGTGGYKAIGVYVNDGAGNTGRGLGKYQFMSYGPARDIIRQKPGGQDFLNQVDSPKANVEQLQALTDKLFTQQEQESLMDSQIRHLADVGTAQGLQGDELLRRMAEMHEGGDGVRDGVDPIYSSSVISDYKKGGTPCPIASQGNGKPGLTTGKFIKPLQGAVVTEEYLPDSNNHRGRPHRGTDFAGVPVGTPILAVDGGTVARVDFDNGWGNYVIIDHGNGYATLYAHMVDKSPLTVGQPVAQGVAVGGVGSTGRSSAPHLHLELIQGYVSGDTYSGNNAFIVNDRSHSSRINYCCVSKVSTTIVFLKL